MIAVRVNVPSEDMTFVNVVFMCHALAVAGWSHYDGKRLAELIFPKGTVFTVTVSMTSFLPKDVAMGIGQVFELDFMYPIVPKMMPKKAEQKTVWPNPFLHSHIKRMESEKFKRNQKIKRRQRRNLKAQLENAVGSLGYGGDKCVRRFQCELNTIRNPQTALEDLLLILFKESNLDCGHAENLCPFSLLQIILHSQRLDEDA